MKSRNLLILTGVFLIVLCNSIVYGALNTDMFIDGDAYVRVDRNIRVTGIRVIEQVGGAYETYNCDYSKDTTSVQVTLPNSDSSIVYEVTITNKGDIDYELTSIAEESYSNSNIKYEILDLENGTVIDRETTYTFKIRLTTTENDSENKGTLVLKYTFEEWIPSLYKMVAHKSRGLDNNIDFGVDPIKETSGVYEMNSTKDDEYPVYYYRGIIDNNNVNFAGFCWKAVRTTSTGGVKLIYNGVPAENGSCDNTGEASQIGESVFNSISNDAKYVGYTYDENTDSTVKGVIDKWYSDNMVEYTGMLEDTIWCNDRSVYREESGIAIRFGQFYGENHITTLDCPRLEDSFTVSETNGNGKLIYPIALLTSPEIKLAGYLIGGYNVLGYLYTGQESWLLTPDHFNIRASQVIISSIKTSYTGNYPYNSLGVRPSVSLANGTMIKEGNGSINNPYKLVENKIKKEWNFDYTGGEQEFSVPYDGEYKVELWGASGADWSEDLQYVGKGAYTSGNIDLKKDMNLYIYIGEGGKNWEKNRPFGEYSFNGASGGSYACNGGYNYYGGSATDIRLVGGSWDNSNSLNSRIMVAAGGSSCGNPALYASGMPGGGLSGYGTTSATGATQTEGGGPSKGEFGKGGSPVNISSICNHTDRHGAGSGYYGGGVNNNTGSYPNGKYGGGSGSSFISGHTGCVAITSEQDRTPKSGCTTGTTDNNCSIHYSGKTFTNTKMIDGSGYNWTNTKGEYTEMPTHDGTSTMIGNTGDGYAKITLISKK